MPLKTGLLPKKAHFGRSRFGFDLILKVATVLLLRNQSHTADVGKDLQSDNFIGSVTQGERRRSRAASPG